ncbi:MULTISPECIES: oligoribonuclease [Micrococcus]|uniref:Oligoribonuclease n=1 Tax=Micrococcus yunnanensis TaxID=566027 RepID=A0AAP5T925_9MICC|nr:MULTISPECIES: oligoribonuclease [Micrococcus]EZP32576.1 Exonuclease [Micrococcus luteus]MCD0178570.1 oligoribonuclease [Micrococcus luteus]MDV7177379.1 oligoribonuclease [Micrococcus yunnanensis]TQF76038.1 oligoribonuclease [Micrococcus sp. R8502A1]WRQ42917.1 oligoribonuclease [Micrococcus sp. HOU1]
MSETSTPTPESAPLVWIDCEMTGLHPQVDELVEVAVLITDAELNILDEGIDLVIRPSEAALEQMDPFVRDMHTTSGLLSELAEGLELDDAAARVLEYIAARVPAGKGLLAGNTVGQDKLFLARYMPAVVDHLHYRIVDVSTVKELARRWYPRAYYQAPAKTGGHRALGDIKDSITELRYYRAAVMAPAPGPTTEEARAIAEVVSGAQA